MTFIQPRLAKDKIIKMIEELGPQTAQQIGEMLGTGHRSARSHLRTLQAYGEVFIVKGSSPILFTLEREKTTEPAVDTFSLPVVKNLVPAGQWRIDHAIHPRSVFELGAV